MNIGHDRSITETEVMVLVIFYARVSTEEQNEARQLVTAQEVNAERVFIDKLSGKNTNRPELMKMMEFVRDGDTVIVSELSRLARSTKDLLSLVEQFQVKKVEFKSLKECFDTTTPQGRFVLTIFAALAELERAMILQRQAEGIAVAKKAGKYKGRKRIQIDDKLFKSACDDWHNGNKTAKALAKQFGISRQTFYTLVKRMDEPCSLDSGE